MEFPLSKKFAIKEGSFIITHFKRPKYSEILASLTEAPAFVFRRLSALVGQVSQTMGNCLKSPTADDVSLLREGGNNSNSVEQLEQQPYHQVILVGF